MYFKTRGLYYDRRKNFYRNQKKKNSDIIGVSFLAQCLISIILRKPDFARARPSTLLDDDITYNQLYSTSTNLEAYYKVACIGKLVKQHIKKDTNLSQIEKSDILFALIYAMSRKLTKKDEISFNDIQSIDLAELTEDLLNDIKRSVLNIYKELGANSTVAKSASFTEEIDKVFA
jgi:hypothetical protein